MTHCVLTDRTHIMPIGFEFCRGFPWELVSGRMLVGVVRGDFLTSAAVMCGAYLLIFDFGERHNQ